MTRPEQKESTAGYTLLVYMVFLVLQITLIPFQFKIPEKLVFTWHFYISGLVTNVFLFVPIGFLFRLGRGTSRDLFCFSELLFGTGLSLAIEVTQAFMPGRVSSGYDILANGIGAWLGAVIFVVLKRIINKEKAAGVFALELPLMNLVYLLIPLLWLSGLATGRQQARLLPAILPALFGSYLLVSIYYHRFYGKGVISLNKFALLVSGWFFISTVPALMRFPLFITIAGISVGLVAWIRVKIPFTITQDSRRYELPTLKRVLPIFLAYLLILFMWPTTLDLGTLQEIYLTGGKTKVFLIFCFLERFAAYTLLGYIIAEMRGRRDERIRITLAMVLVTALCSVALHSVLRGYGFSGFATLLEWFFMVGAALYGAIVYRLQLTAIRKLFWKDVSGGSPRAKEPPPRGVG
ncbi:MAG: VanZ family protein [bacterium]|nr:VanZ family protein [bacterium]